MELNSNEPVTGSIKRIAHELNSQSIEALRNAVGREHEVIHDVRKNLKKIRAVIRLIRDELGNEIYKKENTHYRDAGRQISDLRDATSLIEALDRLKGLYEKDLEHKYYIAVKEYLVEKRDKMSDQLLNEESILENLEKSILEADKRIQDWPIRNNSFATIKRSFLRVYQRGFSMLGYCMKDNSSEHLHEWRKRAKYLMYQLRVLLPLWPGMIERFDAEVNQLTDFLGNDHDLALLTLQINANDGFSKDGNPDIINVLIKNRRKVLQEQAFLLGKKIYAENPYNFVDRFETYWKSWELEGKLSLSAESDKPPVESRNNPA